MRKLTAASFAVILVIMALVFLACGSVVFAAGGGDCVAADKLEKEIVPEAELVELSCSI